MHSNLEEKYYIWSPSTQGKSGSNYIFRGSRGRVVWPKSNGAFLGATGVWNFLFRIGIVAEIIKDERFLPSFSKKCIIFITLENPLEDEETKKSLRQIVLNGCNVVASGCPEAWLSCFPELFCGRSDRCDNPYAGLAYSFPGEKTELIAPHQWQFFRFDENENPKVKQRGLILSVQGERQTPKRALLVKQLNAPAVIQTENFIFLNCSPFHAFQSWLQGQVDISPWLQWRHRLFWLDEMVSYLRGLLVTLGVLPSIQKESLFPELGDSCIVLRHDLDHSKDSSFFDEEERYGMHGVHAILGDSNVGHWVKKLRNFPQHEAAFHYNTGKYSRFYNWLRRSMGLPSLPYTPQRRAIVGKGLYKQVKWAKKHAVGIGTLHRHLSFLQYPEIVDALDFVFDSEPEVLGASSMFRSQVLRWGHDRSDGASGTYVDFPDVQFPYWLPFKLGHAGYKGKRLSGWEAASLMEPEPELVRQLLDYHVEGLHHRVFTLNFHPAHAQTTTFSSKGSLSNFREILEIIKQRDVCVLTLSDLYNYLNSKILIK